MSCAGRASVKAGYHPRIVRRRGWGWNSACVRHGRVRWICRRLSLGRPRPPFSLSLSRTAAPVPLAAPNRGPKQSTQARLHPVTGLHFSEPSLWSRRLRTAISTSGRACSASPLLRCVVGVLANAWFVAGASVVQPLTPRLASGKTLVASASGSVTLHAGSQNPPREQGLRRRSTADRRSSTADSPDLFSDP